MQYEAGADVISTRGVRANVGATPVGIGNSPIVISILVRVNAGGRAVPTKSWEASSDTDTGRTSRSGVRSSDEYARLAEPAGVMR